VLGRARSAPLLSLSYITSGTPGIGYSVAAGSSRDVIVYAESPLPANHRLAIASDSAFSDFQYALYVETTAKHPYLLATSEQHLPLSGQQATERIPFGDATFVLDMSPRGPLEGSFFANFAWIVGGAGLAVAIGAAVMTERLSHRRRLAEQIAAQLERIAKENERLYDEQRTIAETLQHALLPDVLPDVDGLETRARYVAGSLDVDVGGDWYDVVRLEDGRALVVVGDVSGRGVKAAAVMASLRFATRAYALQGDSPATILSKLSWHLSIAESGHFATAVCVLVDVAGHSLTFTNAGHPPPLLAVDGTGAYLDGNVGIPIGIVSNPSYETTTVPVPPDATVLLFTDGLVERRGETLDVGLEKLRDAVVGSKGSLDDVLSDLESGLMPERLDDDTAMVGLRWTK
jgi:serine phosphatase RsbU (regulator of sigma subunit)